MSVTLTHGYFIHEDEKEAKIMRPYPPLGILYLSAYLSDHQITNNVFDSTFSSFEDLKAHLIIKQPKFLGLYANLVTKLNLLKIVDFVKSHDTLKNTVIFAGGPDVTYNYENYLVAGIDYIVIGEGEQTTRELVQAISQNQGVEAVDGIAYMKAGEVVKNNPRIKIKHIDELPFPNREAIDMTPYLQAWKNHHGRSTMSVSTQRGCPYTCKWCSTAVYGQSYRRRSPKLVADEVAHLIKNYQVESLWFVDDVFTVSHKWINELYLEFKERNLQIPFECITRAERLTDEVLLQLKAMGCEKIWIGAESGSQKIIDAMDRRVQVEHVREMIIKAKQYGIESGTFIMIGYPNETLEDIKETVSHLKLSLPSSYTITITYPIKGTDLYNEVASKIVNPKDWSVSTDRDIEFERPYSPWFYKNAVRYIVNEVEATKSWKESKQYLTSIKHKTKAIFARLAMAISN